MKFYRAIHLSLQMECAGIMFRIVVAHAQDFWGSQPCNFLTANTKAESPKTATYDHRQRTTPDPVCSPHDKPLTGELVVRWVTTGE